MLIPPPNENVSAATLSLKAGFRTLVSRDVPDCPGKTNPDTSFENPKNPTPPII